MKTFHTTRQRGPARRSNAGVVLIESLISILIFSMGVLGMVGLQASMTKAQASSKFRGDASYLASGLIGTMWSDNIAANLPKYTTAQCESYAPCNEWLSKVAVALPGGSAEITVDAGNNVTVTIQWTVPGESAHNYATRASLQP